MLPSVGRCQRSAKPIQRYSACYLLALVIGSISKTNKLCFISSEMLGNVRTVVVVFFLFCFPQRKGSNTSLTIMHYRVKILETLNRAVKLWLLDRQEHKLILTCNIFHKTFVLFRFNIIILFTLLSQILI